eukprot:s3494_g4.t1
MAQQYSRCMTQRKQQSPQHRESWSIVRKRIFKEARDSWKEPSFEMRRRRAEFSRRAKHLNAAANRRRDALLICKATNDAQSESRDSCIKEHQLRLLDVAVNQGMICPHVLQDEPVIWKQHALPFLAQRQDIVPLEDLPDHHLEGSGQVCDNANSEAVQKDSARFLYEHGHGLHGLGDSKFGLSESIVQAAMQAPGFVKQSDLQFKSEHSTVCPEAIISLDDTDYVENDKSCQQLCGRYCRSEVQHPDIFRNAIEMIKSVARVLASRRDVKNGNTIHLSPSARLPVLIIKTPLGLFGRLACRVAFKPLEVDWIRCSVSNVADSDGNSLLRVVLQFDTLSDSSRLCPCTDTMCELAIWISKIFMMKDGYGCTLYTDYELDEQHDHILLIRSEHESSSTTSMDEHSFKELVKEKHKEHKDRVPNEEEAESKQGRPKSTGAQSSDDRPVRSAADVLLAQLVPHNPSRSADDTEPTGPMSSDEVEADWAAALDVRYGTVSDQQDKVSKSEPKSQNQRKRSMTSETGSVSRDADISSVVEILGFLQDPALDPPVDDCEMPIRSTVDPTNNRVIAEFADGKKKALGFSTQQVWA